MAVEQEDGTYHRVSRVLDPQSESDRTVMKLLSEWGDPQLDALLSMVQRAGSPGEDPVCSRCLSAPGPLVFVGRDHGSGEWLFSCADCDDERQ